MLIDDDNDMCWNVRHCFSDNMPVCVPADPDNGALVVKGSMNIFHFLVAFFLKVIIIHGIINNISI
jgi:hypothetical protein